MFKLRAKQKKKQKQIKVPFWLYFQPCRTRYIEAVKALRDYNSSYDELVIFAGACQSCYECLLDAGANFASSPSRVLIHCLDPVFVCEKIAYTKIDEVVSITDVVEGTITGIKGIGGLQTRGKYREGYPKSNYI